MILFDAVGVLNPSKYIHKNLLYAFEGSFITPKYKETIKKNSQKIIIDSGAFSFWSTGKTVKIGEYIKFLDDLRKYGLNFYAINLDVIPGKKGRDPTQKEIDLACEQSVKNFRILKSEGFDILPVFHAFDHWHYLDYWVSEKPSILCLSASNDFNTKQKIKFFKKCFIKVPKNQKTHGLGLSGNRILTFFPFYSVDSTLVLQNSRFLNLLFLKNGKLCSKKLKKNNPLFFNNQKPKYREIYKYNLQVLEQYQNFLTGLWAKRGFMWED